MMKDDVPYEAKLRNYICHMPPLTLPKEGTDPPRSKAWAEGEGTEGNLNPSNTKRKRNHNTERKFKEDGCVCVDPGEVKTEKETGEP